MRDGVLAERVEVGIEPFRDNVRARFIKLWLELNARLSAMLHKADASGSDPGIANDPKPTVL